MALMRSRRRGREFGEEGGEPTLLGSREGEDEGVNEPGGGVVLGPSGACDEAAEAADEAAAEELAAADAALWPPAAAESGSGDSDTEAVSVVNSVFGLTSARSAFLRLALK